MDSQPQRNNLTANLSLLRWMESKTKTLLLSNLWMARDDGSWAALAPDGDRNRHTSQKMSPFFKVSHPDLTDKLNMLNGCWAWGRGCFNKTQMEEEPNGICKLQATAWTHRCLVSLKSLTSWDLQEAQEKTQMLQPLSCRHLPRCHLMPMIPL